MNEKVLRICEYNKIIEMLASHATSAPGRTLCMSLEPMSDVEDINKALDQTDAALGYLFRNGSLSFGNTRDFAGTLKALAVGTSLSIPELLHIASFLENVSRVKAAGVADEDSPLFDLFDCLYPITPLQTEIRRCILAEDQVADEASSELRRIRRAMSQTEDKIHAQLGRMLNVTYSSYIQDTVITMRNDRYCLPIKSEYKSQVRGIVHDSSASGSTLFIEPAAIVELGNQFRELQVQEKKEIERILAELSAQASDHIIEIRDDAANMAQLDFIFAKASLAMDMNATRPIFNDRHYVCIRKGRHPLIDPKKVVPIDLSIGRDDAGYDMIIITGPNTGGKTVTLKTVGLFELMGMAGLHIPASDRSELSVFREVYADIGDEQSIEQSLSTFSSHMTSIVDILKRADRECLCLFDELGSGTDPTEGAALAISILNFMHVRKITTLATTHYAELKLFAMRTEGIVNASCEFDVESLQPTYRLLVGVPGKSNAFAISKKLGLPGYIIETAKEQISQESRGFEEVLADLEDTRREAERAKEEAQRLKEQLDKREKDIRNRENQIEEKKRRILEAANAQARDILQDAKDTADRAISEIRRSGKGVDITSMEHTRTALREQISDKNSSLQRKAPKEHHKQLRAEDLQIGSKVRIVSAGMEGIVASLPDKSGRLSVRCGILHTQTTLKDLVFVTDEEDLYGSSAKSTRTSAVKKAFAGSSGASKKMDLSRSMAISPEINLLGMTTDEAIMALDKYLDDARMSHLDSVRVVHGKGTGALRNAVQNYLRKQKWVRSYRAGDFGEGDAGVTIVYL
ncbi:MAG: endonuclease MutS2 [Lachnospiraceae bacterium]|nr:endonuclease MutS2 [Lachnospiraceae bacterium]